MTPVSFSMEILIIGTEEQSAECRLKFSGGHIIRAVPHADQAGPLLKSTHVVFDFATAENLTHGTVYPTTEVPIFFDTSVVRLADIEKQCGPWKGPVFGFCGLRTLVNRDILEVVLQRKEDQTVLAAVCEKLGSGYRIVADQAGMVTPRVIGMIVNEAYFTLEDGTATREDIDLAMKLGTNYPYGPFEWAERIGLKNVVTLMSAVYRETGDERYLICPLLKKEAETL